MLEDLEETNIPCDIQTLSCSDGQELHSRHPCGFLLKQKVSVGESDLWATEKKLKNRLNSTLEILHL